MRPSCSPGAGQPQFGGYGGADLAPHGTTIVATVRRRRGHGPATAERRWAMSSRSGISKVFPADEYSMVGIAGTAGLAMELVRTFQLG